MADLQQKYAALAECRTSVVAATWNVNMDDQEVDWDLDGNVTIDGEVVDWDGDLQGVEETDDVVEGVGRVATSMDQSPEPRRKG